VPVAAARLAHVLVRDAREWVAGRVEQQLLAGAPRFLLAAAARVERLADLSRLGGQVVADALELGEAQERGAGPAAVHGWRKRRAERAELLVEPRDLVAERAARGRVVRLERREKRRLDGHRHVIRLSARWG